MLHFQLVKIKVQRTVTLDDAILNLEHSKLGYQL